MTEPYLGEPGDESGSWTCAYAPSPAAPLCGADATWHGVVLEDPAQASSPGMSSCDAHLPPMRKIADYVHPHRHPCCVPGALFRWPENECRLNVDWDDAALALGAGRAVVA